MADDIVTKTKTYTDKVRNAMYGKEVRSSIADSIDGIAQNVKDEIARDTILNDVKTGVDGTVYNSAGEAVRGQVNDLKKDLICENKLGKWINGGYPNSGNSGKIESNAGYYYSPYIPIRQNEYVTTFGTGFICYYDTDKNYINSPNPAGYNVPTQLGTPNKAKYCRVATVNPDGECGLYECDLEYYNENILQFHKRKILNDIDELKKALNNTNLLAYKNVIKDTYYNSTTDSTGNHIITVNNLQCNMKTYEPVILNKGTYIENNINTTFSFLTEDINGQNPTKLSSVISESTLKLNKTMYLWISCAKTSTPSLESDNSFNDVIPVIEDRILRIENRNNVIYCGKGEKFTKLKDAIEEGLKVRGSTIYANGIFDLIDEFGEDYFTNLDNSSEKAGIWLYNDIHIIFTSNSRVLCNYTGNNANVNKYFSPFNSCNDYHGSYGYVVENLNLEASNVRYCFHDEHVNDKIPYFNKYINCRMSLDNSNNTNWQAAQCIGSGLGAYGNIEIDGCIFDSLYNNGVNTETVSYHNTSTVSDAKSHISIKNSYILHGTFAFHSYGATTENTEVEICGCSVEKEILETTYEGYHKNINVIKWNNEIRTTS